MDAVSDQQDNEYFYVSPETGLISLKKILTTSPYNQFAVSNQNLKKKKNFFLKPIR